MREIQHSFLDPRSSVGRNSSGQELKFIYSMCHAPNLGPTRSTDPNRFSGRETQDWDSLPDFFFFLNRTCTCGYGPHLITIQNIIYINRVPFTYTKLNFYIYNQSTEPTCSEPFQVCWPAVCGCFLMSSPVPTRIKNPC